MIGKITMAIPVLLLAAGCGGGADEGGEAAPHDEPVTSTPASPDGSFASSPATASPDPGTAKPAQALPTPIATVPSTSPPPIASPAARTPAAPATAIAAAGAAPPAFNQCKVCHAVIPGKHGVGPSLANVFGAKAGHADGYKYSDSLLAARLTWNEPSLHSYLTDPRKTVPGTKMMTPSVRDQNQRQTIIDYLKTL